MVSGDSTPTTPSKDGPSHEDDNAVRCCCGSLLARAVEGGVEFKCRRCKRTLRYWFESGQLEEVR